MCVKLYEVRLKNSFKLSCQTISIRSVKENLLLGLAGCEVARDDVHVDVLYGKTIPVFGL